jgi:hypothetical protein
MGRGLQGLALAALVAAATTERAAAQEPVVSIVPSIAVTERYSDNIDRLPGGSRSGFTTNVTPRLAVASPIGRLTGAAAYALSLRVEHFDGGDTDVDHDAFALLEYSVSPRWRLYLRENFRVSPDPDEDLIFVTPEGRVFRTFEEAARTPGVDVLDLSARRAREDELRNRTTLGTAYDLTPRWSVAVDGTVTLVDVRAGFLAEDSTSLEAAARTRYRLTPVDDVSLALRGEQTDYESSPDASIVRFQLGWDRQLLETVRFGVRGGYALVSTDEAEGVGSVEDENEYYVNATVSGDSPEGDWRLSAERDIETSEGVGDVTERRAIEARVLRRLGRLLSAEARLGYLESRSLRGFTTDTDAVEAAVSASYRFIRWAVARASYRFRRDEPARGGRAADENQFLVGIEILWPLRELTGLGSDS